LPLLLLLLLFSLVLLLLLSLRTCTEGVGTNLALTASMRVGTAACRTTQQTNRERGFFLGSSMAHCCWCAAVKKNRVRAWCQSREGCALESAKGNCKSAVE